MERTLGIKTGRTCAFPYAVCLLACICVVTLSAQMPPRDIPFEHITLEHGLSQGTVYCIHQDRKGFLWFGTQDGLNRYDGSRFVVYRPEPGNPHSIVSNWIRCMYEDRHGDLWIGTIAGGLSRFHRETGRFTNYVPIAGEKNSLRSPNVRYLCEDRSGRLWIGSEKGLDVMDPERKTIKRFPCGTGEPGSLSGTRVSGLGAAPDGHLWIGLAGGGINRLDPSSGKVTYFRAGTGKPGGLKSDAVSKLFVDAPGHVWLTTPGYVSRFEPEKKRFFHYPDPADNDGYVRSLRAWTFYRDSRGCTWLGGDNGLFVFDKERDGFYMYRANPANPTSLSSTKVRSIYEDRTGVLWIGSRSTGLNRFNRSAERFRLYRHNPGNPAGIMDNKVWSLREGPDGSVWVGTNRGLNRLNPETGTFTHYFPLDKLFPSGRGNTVWTLFQDRAGMLWLGTDAGLHSFDPGEEKFRHYPVPDSFPTGRSSSVSDILEDSTGTLWLGTYWCLQVFNRETSEFTFFKPDPGNPRSISHERAYCLLEDRSRQLWIGTADGLNLLDRETQTFTVFRGSHEHTGTLSNNCIFILFQDRRGTLWVGTNGGGLNRMNRVDNTFTHYDIQDGLPNNVIYGILEDDGGNLWISTNNGICRFNPGAGTFRTYFSYDGLQGNEFNAGAAMKTGGGKMYFGGTNGLSAFFPRDITDNPNPPAVVITDFKLFNRSLGIGEAVDRQVILERTVSETEELTLAYRQSVFTFEYAGLHYASASKNRYAYKMEPVDTHWNHVGNRRFATFAHLPSGEYRFRVRAANSDGVWNKEGVSIKLVITPPFWKTTWFYALCVLVLGTTLVTLHQLRVRRLKRHEGELEQQVESRTRELRESNRVITSINAELAESKQEAEEASRSKSLFLARMSHEIRTPMNGILGFTDLLMETALNPDQEDFASTIRQSGRALLGIINDILDISKVEAGELSLENIDFAPRELAEEVCNLVGRRLAEKPVELTFRVDEEAPPFVKGDPGRIRQVLLNLLGNAAKFTSEGEIELFIGVDRVDEEKDRLLLRAAVKDTGPGIPPRKLATVFESYKQVGESTSRVYGGTGLGLPICKQLSHLMGGDVTVESVEGKGSTFHFTAWLDRSAKT